MNDLYVFWTGDNEIPDIRMDCINSIRANSKANVVLVDNKNLSDYISPCDIHPAYHFLNLAHKADYLRCYFMHHFGGGYCDIKKVSNSWEPSFSLLSNDDNLMCVGYPEVNRWGVGNLYKSYKLLNKSNMELLKKQALYRFYQLNYKKLIGNCAFIFKPNTPITQEWWNSLNMRLDYLLPDLQKNPAKYPKDYRGKFYDGVRSDYAVPWSFILADIIQPLSYKYRNCISRSLPKPDFNNYQ